MKRIAILLLPVLILTAFAPIAPLVARASGGAGANTGASSVILQATTGCYEPHTETPGGKTEPDGDEICPTSTATSQGTPVSTGTPVATGTPVSTGTPVATGTPVTPTASMTATMTATSTPIVSGAACPPAPANATPIPLILPPGSGGGFVNEVPGFRTDQLSTEFWFPWYDNLTMTTFLLIGNPGSADAHVNVSIAGNAMGSFTVPAGGRITPQFAIQDGPVQVTSDATIFASEQVFNAFGFVNEMMGAPKEELTTEWWFPWYDNFSMMTWIIVANPSTSATAHVSITIANNVVGTYDIAPQGRVTPRFQLMDGPVHIVSDIPVVSSQRNHTANGFTQETMAYPSQRLSNNYWFPWYDDISMSNWVLVGNTSSTLNTHVCIYIASNLMVDTIIPAGGRITPVFSMQNGPVQVLSDNPVVTSIREHTNGMMIQETMGQAADQLSTHYLLPSYNNTSLKSSILLGNPSTTATANVTITVGGVSAGTFTVAPQGIFTATIPNVQDGTVDIQSDIPIFLTERTAS